MDANTGPSGIEAATLAFITAIRSDAEIDLGQIEARDDWAQVRAAVEQVVPRSIRADLYRDGELTDWVLLRVSGLAQAVADRRIGAADLAAQFEVFCTRSAPQSEDWILLDASVPLGAQVPLGDYVLEARGYRDLLALHPLPCVAAADDESVVLPPRPLAGAAFLRRVRADREIPTGMRFIWTFDQLVELEHWKPLLAMTLWSPQIVRAEAAYEVEAGRRVTAAGGRLDLILEIYHGPDGAEEEYQRHQTLGIELTETDLSAFTVFTAAVLERVERIMAGLTRKGKGGQKLARRLEAAAGHVLRAAHRTYGPDGHYDVAAYELNEVLLHYVIAMEALLADESDHLDLSRKVQYRAATLFATDDERLAVSKLVKEAYAARSKYVHGDEVTAFDLEALRRTACQVLLRWLVLAAGSRAEGPVAEAQAIPSMLDRATLSDSARAECVLRPLAEFFAKPLAQEPVG